MGKVEEAMDQCGVNGYVVKPFTAEVLQKKLGPIIDKLYEAQRKPVGFFGSLAAKLA
jgi:YesN/AraC family two-component response regulator